MNLSQSKLEIKLVKENNNKMLRFLLRLMSDRFCKRHLTLNFSFDPLICGLALAVPVGNYEAAQMPKAATTSQLRGL